MYNVVLYWKAGIVFIETELVIFNVYTRSAKNCGICFQFNEWIHNVVFIIRIIFLLFSRWYCFHWRDHGLIDPLFIRINVQGLVLLLMYVMFILRMSEFFLISRKILLWYQGWYCCHIKDDIFAFISRMIWMIHVLLLFQEGYCQYCNDDNCILFL